MHHKVITTIKTNYWVFGFPCLRSRMTRLKINYYHFTFDVESIKKKRVSNKENLNQVQDDRVEKSNIN